MFLIYGEDRFLVQKQLDKIINIISPLKQDNIFKFDALDDSFTEIFDVIDTPPLFSDKKIVIIDNCLFLTNDKKYELSKVEEQKILRFCKQNSDLVVVFFIAYENNIAKWKKITKSIEKYGKLLWVKPLNFEQLKLFVKNYLQKNQVTISSEGLEQLLLKLPNNLQIIVNELNKLINYSSEINAEIVKKLVSDYLDTNIFTLVNAFFQQDFNNVWKYYYEFKNGNQDVLLLMTMIANQLRLIRDIKIYQRKTDDFTIISQKLAINPYRLKMLSKFLKIIEEKQINYLLTTLSNLDYNIKRGSIEKNIGFEIFLLKI